MRLVYDEAKLKQGAHIHQPTAWPCLALPGLACEVLASPWVGVCVTLVLVYDGIHPGDWNLSIIRPDTDDDKTKEQKP